MTGAGEKPDRGHRARRALPEAGRLESSYRRLLIFYPASCRRVHEEEMLAVLMTGAPPGKCRPGIGEAADLVWGALRVRCQPQRVDGEPAWRDALAVLSVILPVIVLLVTIVQQTQSWLFTPGLVDYGLPLSVLEQPALAVAVVALVLLRLRRAAALAAVVMVIWVALLSGGSTYVYATAEAYLFVPLVLEIVALTASPGPPRGLQILTWKHGVLVVIVTLTVSYAATLNDPVTLVVITVTGAAMALASSLGRWLLVLLAIAVWPSFLTPELPAPWRHRHQHHSGRGREQRRPSVPRVPQFPVHHMPA
jgi:hypothetical protein